MPDPDPLRLVRALLDIAGKDLLGHPAAMADELFWCAALRAVDALLNLEALALDARRGPD